MEETIINTQEEIKASLNKQFFILAVPITCTYLLMILSRTMETILSSKYDVSILGALSILFLITGLPMTLINGILYTAVPQYSYLKEQGQLDKVYNLFIEYLIIAIVLAISISLIFIFAIPWLLYSLDIAPTLISLIIIYLKFVLPFVLGMVIYNHLYFFSESYGVPALATVTVLIGLAVQGIVIYIFVFSHLFKESWGITGFALSGIFLAWTKVSVLLIILIKHKTVRMLWRKPMERLHLSVKRMTKNTLKGLPTGLDFLSEWLVFLIMGLLIAKLGVNEIGAHGIMQNILMLTIIFSVGFGRAASILVSQYQDSSRLLKKTVYIVIRNHIIVYTGLVILLYISYSLVISMYEPSQALLPILKRIYLAMLLVMIFMGMTNVLAYTLRGLSDFLVVFTILLFSLWCIFLPLAYLLSSTHYLVAPLGILGWWYAWAFAFLIATSILAVRLYFFINKRLDNLIVIEKNSETEKVSTLI